MPPPRFLLPIPLAQYPEPFRSHEAAITRRLPNVHGLPGASLALAAMAEGRKAGRDCPTPMRGDAHQLPSPLPAPLYSPLREAALHDSAVRTLVAAYWAYGFCCGIYDQMPSRLGPAIAADSKSAPEWAEWFHAYALAGFQYPRTFWPNVPPKPRARPVRSAPLRCPHGMLHQCDACEQAARDAAFAASLPRADK